MKRTFIIFALLALAGCGNEGGQVCKPGEQVACACPGGAPDGAQACNGDGSGYGECVCKDGTGGTAGTGGSSAGTGGSAGKGGAAGMAGSAGTGGTMAAMLSCDAYCAEMAKNCTGQQSQYLDAKGCQGICTRLDEGTLGDTTGDTLGCREYHGGDPAKGNPMTHCPHAGPLGEGTCSTDDCDAFCKLAVAVCGTQATPPYPDVASCKVLCAAYPDTKAVSYNSTVTVGNSLACRMYHLTVASNDDASAKTHCPHVGLNSDPCQ